MKRWPPKRHWPKRAGVVVIGLVLVMVGLIAFQQLRPTTTGQKASPALKQLRFKTSATSHEQASLAKVISEQKLSGRINVSLQTTTSVNPTDTLVSAYIPVASLYNTLTSVEQFDPATTKTFVTSDVDKSLWPDLAKIYNLSASNVTKVSNLAAQLKASPSAFGIIPIDKLSPSYKLLTFQNAYYLDSFSRGAAFRAATFSGVGADRLKNLQLSGLPSKSTIFKLNMSGVTALTRQLLLKIKASGDPEYPAKNIGTFLADADLTHTSSEVSFKPGCQLSDSSFCALPDSIKTLDASGIDIVELTGNHNNDAGSDADASTIKSYHDRSWGTFGGGLNSIEAAKPFIANKKGSQVALLGYNYYDTIHPSSALANSNSAGANSFDFTKIQSDIAVAKTKTKFVIVDVQYQECYSYPDGYVLMPACYQPINNPDQKTDFRKIIDLGADIVIGTQAHQPQTFESYHGKTIYYGLGNLFFDQVDWPGTEQGMILSHYFEAGKLIQTKLSPTVYDKTMQTRLMTAPEAKAFLGSLNAARP